MRLRRWSPVVICTAALTSAAWAPEPQKQTKKPIWSYALCDHLTPDGWELVDSTKNDEGRFTYCMYQAPNKQMTVEFMCYAHGCDDPNYFVPLITGHPYKPTVVV